MFSPDALFLYVVSTSLYNLVIFIVPSYKHWFCIIVALMYGECFADWLYIQPINSAFISLQ